MKYLLLSLLIFGFGISGFGQTIKSLGYNTTNGQVVANTGTNVLTFTNDFVKINTISAYVGDLGVTADNVLFDATIEFTGTNVNQHIANTRANLGFSTNLNTLWTATNSSNARSAVGLGATWLTNTNVTNFRTAIGLGSTDNVILNEVQATSFVVADETNSQISFEGNSASTTRTNLGLGATWLTNTNKTTFLNDIGALATNGSAEGLSNFPTLNQNTTGTASNVTGVVAISNGGTGANVASSARTNLGLPLAALTNSTAATFLGAVLPAYSNNAGKVLAVNSGATGVEWITTAGTNTNLSNLSLPIAITNGGTGATNEAIARTNLGLGSFASDDGFSVIADESNNAVISTENGIPLFYSALTFTTTNAAATTRTNLSLGATWLTNTNVTNFRTAIGLGSTNDVFFRNLQASIQIESSSFFISDGGNINFEDSGTINFGSAAPSVRANLDLGATWLTNTNITNFRTAIGLGATNDVTFKSVNYDGELTINNSSILGWSAEINFEEARFSYGAYGAVNIFDWGTSNKLIVGLPIEFANTTNAATTRANLGFSTNLNTLWTATNAADARTALSIGTNGGSVYNQDLNTTNNVSFNAIHIERDAISVNYTLTIGQTNTGFKGIGGGPSDFVYARDGANILGLYSGEIQSLVTHRFSAPMVLNYGAGNTAVLQFGGIDAATGAAISRTNLGLGGGITTNRTFVSYNGTNYTTNSVTISNGIITGWTQ